MLGLTVLRAGSNMHDIPGIFQEYSKNYFINQLLLIGRIFNGIFLVAAVCYVFVPLKFQENIAG